MTCDNCGWELDGTEERCPSCLATVSRWSAATGGRSDQRTASPRGRPPEGGGPSAARAPSGSRQRRASVFVRLNGRVANQPTELAGSGSSAMVPLFAVAAGLLLLPVLLPALLPLIVLLVLPFIVIGIMFRGAAGPAFGCLGSVARAGRSRERSPGPAGLAFRLRSEEQGLCEVRFRGRPPRVELGDDIELTGLVVGAIVHPLRLRNTTTGEHRVGQTAVAVIALGVILVLVLPLALQ